MTKYEINDQEISDILELIFNDIDEAEENNNYELAKRMKQLYNKLFHQVEEQK